MRIAKGKKGGSIERDGEYNEEEKSKMERFLYEL